MNLNIYSKEKPAETPIRLKLNPDNLDSVHLDVVDESGAVIDTILCISNTSNNIYLYPLSNPKLGFKLDSNNCVKVRKGGAND